ncbi:sugar nucleotide-binding protein [Arsukibacterium perlucidum]|uniref:sugar nucleotide-binding protein n=1 Tax=Arsukibacterium perlucidum TaxID=368811 RepID=UPI000379C189|nr:sugar nucleotide-binding protein [Arsukibacterium perlucidum]
MASILLVGLGDLGSRIASCALDVGIAVSAMRRSPGCPQNVTLFQHDAALPWPAIAGAYTDLVLCVAPDGRNDPAYHQAYLKVGEQALVWLQQQAQPVHVWLVSSTSVYGQQQGEWVTEDSPRQPQASTARILVEAEEFWFKNSPHCTILRPAGLYGPGRNMMIETARKAVHFIENEPVYTNRIEVSDCARAIVHLVQRRQLGHNIANAYNLADLQPTPFTTVIDFLQQQLRIAPESIQQRNRGSKRVSVTRLQQTGFNWHYPDYQAGYLAML